VALGVALGVEALAGRHWKYQLFCLWQEAPAGQALPG
jgi:hypothetical protein